MTAALALDFLCRLDDPAAALDAALQLMEEKRPIASPSLAPASGSVPGLDEGREGVTVYRAMGPGKLSGRPVEAGAAVIVSRRLPSLGDLAVVATRSSIRVVATGPAGAVPLPRDGRFLGTVEAVLHGPRRRRQLA